MGDLPFCFDIRAVNTILTIGVSLFIYQLYLNPTEKYFTLSCAGKMFFVLLSDFLPF